MRAMVVQASLFDEVVGVAEQIELPGADLLWVPGLIGLDDGERLFAELHGSTAWRQDEVHMYGRKVRVPRLTAWFGERRSSYSFGGVTMEPAPWTAPLLEIKEQVEAAAGTTFNTALANLYRDGRDSVAWHADDESELGAEPVIASISFGATRVFHLRHAADHTVRHDIALTPGSLLVMRGRTQHNWEHKIAKTAKPIGPRINLTFRQTGAS